MAKEKKEKQEMVKVKILKHMDNYVPGQVVEVEKSLAEQMCIVNETYFGEEKKIHQRAVLLEEFEQSEKKALEDTQNMTVAEAQELGIKLGAAPEEIPVAEAQEAAE